jgi:ClpP class serine protease
MVMDYWSQLFWLFLFVSAMQPVLKQRLLESERLKAIRRFEKKRSSRVITLVHRQESMGFLGFPLVRFINIEDSEEILRAIRMTPDDMPIDVILHTPGGLVLAAEQIARALQGHKAKVTVFVPHYAMSGGTLIAMSADEIVMDPQAVMGPVDPQLGQKPAASVVRVAESKPLEHLDDQTLIEADVARMALKQVKQQVVKLLSERYQPDQAERLAEQLTQGYFTHDYPIGVEEAEELGLKISQDFPMEVHEIMALYPQPQNRRPSVEYIPVPYKTGGHQPDNRH